MHVIMCTHAQAPTEELNQLAINWQLIGIHKSV